MNKEEIKELIFTAIRTVLNDDNIHITDDTPLLGDGMMDSMKLVEVCLALEDLSVELGFDFNWTSDSAMSRSNSIFKTAASLAQEFISQKEANS